MSRDYLIALSVMHDLNPNPITIARAIDNNELKFPILNNLTISERKQLATDIAYHEIQQPWSSGKFGDSIMTSLFYKTSVASKVLSNLHRSDKNEMFEINYRYNLKMGLINIYRKLRYFRH